MRRWIEITWVCVFQNHRLPRYWFGKKAMWLPDFDYVQPARPGNRCIQNNSPSSARMASRVDILIHWLEPCLDECSHGIPPKLRKNRWFCIDGPTGRPFISEIGQLHEIMVSSAVHSDWILSLRLLIFWMAWFGGLLCKWYWYYMILQYMTYWFLRIIVYNFRHDPQI